MINRIEKVCKDNGWKMDYPREYNLDEFPVQIFSLLYTTEYKAEGIVTVYSLKPFKNVKEMFVEKYKGKNIYSIQHAVTI